MLGHHIDTQYNIIVIDRFICVLVHRRRVGHWLTDVTPLAALLPPGAECSMTLQTPSWGSGWRPSLTLRWSDSKVSTTPAAVITAEKDVAMGRGNKLRVEEGAAERGAGGGGGGGGMESVMEEGRDQVVEQRGKEMVDVDTEERNSSSVAGGRSMGCALIVWLKKARMLVFGRGNSRNLAFGGSAQSGSEDSHMRTLRGMAAEVAALVAAASGGELMGTAKVVPLFTGGNFDSDYNVVRKEMHVMIPQGTARVLLVATITGLIPALSEEYCIVIKGIDSIAKLCIVS